MSLVSLEVGDFPHCTGVPNKAAHTHPAQGWFFLGEHPQAHGQLFSICPKFLSRHSVSRTSSTPAEAKKMSPGHPALVRKLARAASFVMSTNQSEKLKTLGRFIHPCTKEGAKLPDSSHSLRTREHRGSQLSPSKQKAAGYANFLWQPDVSFRKAGDLTVLCHSSVLGRLPKPLCALPGRGSRPPRGTKGWGDNPASGCCLSPWQQTLPKNPS